MNETGADETILFAQEEVSLSSAKKIHRLIVRKTGAEGQL